MEELKNKNDLLDFSSEEQAIKSLEELKSYSVQLGLTEDNEIVKAAIDIVTNFDIKARSFCGIIYEDRISVKYAETEVPAFEKVLECIDFKDLTTFNVAMEQIKTLENRSDICDSYYNYIQAQGNMLVLERSFQYAVIPKDIVDSLNKIENYKNGIRLDFLKDRLHTESNGYEEKLGYLQSQKYKKIYGLAEKYANKKKLDAATVVGAIFVFVISFFIINLILGLFLPDISILITALAFLIYVISMIKERSDINSKGKIFWQNLTHDGQVKFKPYE